MFPRCQVTKHTKIGYPSRDVAERYLKAKKVLFNLELYVYHCPVCSQYHLTKQKQEKDCQ